MSVKKIFITLIIIVACVIIGALVLNKLVPNATTALVDAVEGQIYNATGMTFDFNGNSDNKKAANQVYSNTVSKNTVAGTGNSGANVGGIGNSK